MAGAHGDVDAGSHQIEPLVVNDEVGGQGRMGCQEPCDDGGDERAGEAGGGGHPQHAGRGVRAGLQIVQPRPRG